MFRRKQYELLRAHLPKREHSILAGARQTGKSTLLKQLQQALAEEGTPHAFLNLERKDLLLELNQSPEHVFKYLPGGQHGQRAVVLIDEIQYLEDPAHFLKLLYDEHADRLKIVATGSSAFYLDRQFRDSLAGRKKLFELPTLDFEEFLHFTGRDPLLQDLLRLRSGELERSPLESQLWAALETYITWGGYPAVVLEPDIREREERLRDLRDSFVKRDILEAGIADETRFYQLMILLAGQTGSLVNLSEIANTLRMSGSQAEEYLYVLQTCFHLRLLRPFFQNLRKELTKMPKAFFQDLGMRNVLIGYFAPVSQRADKGALLENYVFRRLSERIPEESLRFWRTADGQEVDFVAVHPVEPGQAFEVKFSPAEIHPARYRKFTDAYPAFSLQFLSWRDPALLRL